MRTSSLLSSAIVIVATASLAVADPERDCTLVIKPNIVNSVEPLSPGGGVLVATKTYPASACPDTECHLPPSGTDASNQPTWHFNINDKHVEPVRTSIAPGLTRYDTPTGVTKLVIEGDREHEEIDVRGNKPVLDAPVFKRVFQEKQKRLDGGTFTSTAELAGARPKDAAALVVYGSDGKARDWILARDIGGKMAAFSHDPGTCEFQFPGHVVTQIGDKVRFAWVDLSGRLSAQSAEWEVVSDTASHPTPPPAKKGLRPGF